MSVADNCLINECNFLLCNNSEKNWQMISYCDFYLENLSIHIEERTQQHKMYIICFFENHEMAGNSRN
jgi:hypothetical protein